MSNNDLSNEPLLEVWVRRVLTIPAYAILAVFFVTSLPLLPAIAVATDLLLGRPCVMVRSVLLFTLYFCCETIGVAVSFGLWVANNVYPGRPGRANRMAVPAVEARG